MPRTLLTTAGPLRPSRAAALMALPLVLLPVVARAADCNSNLLIVLDRSCSMQNTIKDPVTGVTATKWDIAVAALEKLSKGYPDLRYGLTMFPDAKVKTGVCAQAAIPLDAAAGNGPKMVTLLKATQPNGPCVTNIDEGLKQAREDLTLRDGARRSFVLLISDGAQSGDCNGGTATADPKSVAYIKALYDLKVPTYVVGFAAASSAKSLNAFADAGGVVSKTDPNNRFYLANNATELNAVLSAIGSNAAASEFGCSGLPCPDNRCLAAGEQCVKGRCVAPVLDMTGSTPPGVDGGGDGPSVASGCSCQTAGTAGALGNGAMIAAALCLSVLRRRRR